METTCSICGISGKMRTVIEVISPKGVVLACEKCISEEGFPVLQRPDKKVFEESDKKSRVSEVMARLSGVKPREQQRRRELGSREKTLREIVDQKYEEKMKLQSQSLKPRPDFVDNFHWVIMRVRRMRGLTQGQLAESIGETESTIKMVEQGVVPQGYGLADKLERFLRIKLIRERNFYDPQFDKTQLIEKNKQEKNQRTSYQQQPNKNISFDRQSLDSLKIADLRRIKMEKEMEKNKLMEEEYSRKKTEGFSGEKEALKMIEDEEKEEP